MNNTFNSRRFGWLFRKTILERPTQMIGLTALSLLITFLLYGIIKLLVGYEDAQNFSFLTGLIGGGCFLASFTFGHFNTNASGSSFLTLPASMFEKWLCGILITGVLYPALFLVFFRLMDMGFVAVYHNSLDPNAPYFQEKYDMVRIFAFNEFIADKTFIIYFNFAGIMLLGSLYFNKAAFIKVALIICGICLGAFLLNIVIAKIFFSNVQTAFPYYLVWLLQGKERGRLELPETTLQVIGVLFRIIIPVTLWALVWLRLREKEF